METKALAHRDPNLNVLRLVAFGALGFYLYKVHQKQGNFSGFNASNPNWRPNPDRIIDSIVPWLNMPPHHKQLIAAAGKSLLRGYMDSKGEK